MSSALFQKVIKEFVGTLGYNMAEWSDADQASLSEGMVLVCKENPDWTEEQVKGECKKQVDKLFYAKFLEEYVPLYEDLELYESDEELYEMFKAKGRKGFNTFLAERRKFNRFCQEFYDDLREMYNICSAGMDDEFERMLKNKWSFAQYRKWLDGEMAKARAAAKAQGR
jgi:hypothetical protein